MEKRVVPATRESGRWKRARRRPSRSEAPPALGQAAGDSPTQCPACSSVHTRRYHRTLIDRLLFRIEIRRCLRCQKRFWSTNTRRARNAALFTIAASCLLLVALCVIIFFPHHPISTDKPDLSPFSRHNRLRLTREQNEALLRQIQGVK